MHHIHHLNFELCQAQMRDALIENAIHLKVDVRPTPKEPETLVERQEVRQRSVSPPTCERGQNQEHSPSFALLYDLYICALVVESCF